MHSNETERRERSLCIVFFLHLVDKCIEINRRQLKLSFTFFPFIRIRTKQNPPLPCHGIPLETWRGCAPPVEEECFVVSRSARSAINVANLETCRFREEAWIGETPRVYAFASGRRSTPSILLELLMDRKGGGEGEREMRFRRDKSSWKRVSRARSHESNYHRSKSDMVFHLNRIIQRPFLRLFIKAKGDAGFV